MSFARARFVAVTTLTLAACKVSVPPFDDPDIRFACHGDDECADGYYCFHEGGADLGYCTSGNTTNDPCVGFGCQNGLVCTVNQQGEPDCQECRYVADGCGLSSICAKSNSTTVTSLCAPSCQAVGDGCDNPAGPGQCIVSQGFPDGNNLQATVQVCASCGTLCAAAECTYASATVDAWEQGAVCNSPPVTCSPHANCGSGWCVNGTCSNNPGQTCSTGCPSSDICGDDNYCHPSNCTTSVTCPAPFNNCTGGWCTYVAVTTCPAVPCGGDDVCVGGTCEPPPWYQLAGSVANGVPGSSGADDFDMTLDDNGNPVLAWIVSGALWLHRWDSLSGTWIDLGQVVASSASVPSIAVASNGDVIVAWQHQVSAADTGIYVMRYVSGSWAAYTQPTYPMSSNTGVGIAMSFQAPTEAYEPRVAVDSANRTLVAWRERDATSYQQVYLRQWNGSTWTELSGSASGTGVSNTSGGIAYQRPALAVAGSDILVGWVASNQVVMARYDVTTWPQMGPGVQPNPPTSLSVAFDKTNNPTAAYEYYDGAIAAPAIEVWRSSGPPQDIGYESYGQQPSLARDNAFNLALAWGTTSSTNHAYLGYFRDDASGWADVDGSRTNEGVSFPVPPAYSASAQNPVIAAGTRLCVAWQENGMIRLRCHNQPLP